MENKRNAPETSGRELLLLLLCVYGACDDDIHMSGTRSAKCLPAKDVSDTKGRGHDAHTSDSAIVQGRRHSTARRKKPRPRKDEMGMKTGRKREKRRRQESTQKRRRKTE